MLRNLVLALALLAGLASSPADAATCFWVGGGATWDNSTDAAHWSSSTGGSGSTCAATGGFPKNAGDVATFDGSSGGGTVTNNVDISIGQITIGAFTGTLDFATNNHAVTLSVAMSLTGAGTKTLNMGSGTWLITAVGGTVWDCTTCGNLTLNTNTSNLKFQATPTSNRTIAGGGKTYNSIEINDTGKTEFAFLLANTNIIITTFVPTSVNTVTFSSQFTITNGFTITGTSAAPVFFGTSFGFGPLSLTTGGAVVCNWCYVGGITKAGAGSITANNSLDGGNNTGVTITPPSTGGGSHIIGG